jgi:hypothetical protein
LGGESRNVIQYKVYKGNDVSMIVQSTYEYQLLEIYKKEISNQT